MEKNKKELIKTIVESTEKSRQCPECNEGTLKTVKRRNFPHGKKSGGKSSVCEVCRNCGFSKYVRKEKMNNGGRRKTRSKKRREKRS